MYPQAIKNQQDLLLPLIFLSLHETMEVRKSFALIWANVMTTDVSQCTAPGRSLRARALQARLERKSAGGKHEVDGERRRTDIRAAGVLLQHARSSQVYFLYRERVTVARKKRKRSRTVQCIGERMNYPPFLPLSLSLSFSVGVTCYKANEVHF